ncbi:UNVERIFIED_CONTAM: hypothetical protein H355_011112 [Colinus virginianus]|nr:hypothetical protein H355_011112 [Colinus virginianus]
MEEEKHTFSTSAQPEASRSELMLSARQRTYLCCEVRLKDGSKLHPLEVREQVHAWLMSSSFAVTLGKQDPQQIANPVLRESCAEINIEPTVPGEVGFLASSCSSTLTLPAGAQLPPLQESPVVLALVDVSVQIVAYRLHRQVVEAEVIVDNEQEVGTPSYQRWTLPHEDLHGLWETLHFDSDTKRNLLQYATTAMLFSDRHIDSKV